MNSLVGIIEENPEAKEAGLSHLCEFIEDCEHTSLATRILHLLGQEGPRTLNPAKYIRFIYNRVILENAAIRAGELTLVTPLPPPPNSSTPQTHTHYMHPSMMQYLYQLVKMKYEIIIICAVIQACLYVSITRE